MAFLASEPILHGVELVQGLGESDKASARDFGASLSSSISFFSSRSSRI